jgi:hypothetical protein
MLWVKETVIRAVFDRRDQLALKSLTMIAS